MAKKDLKAVKIDEDTWYDKALNRQEWLDACREGVSKYHQVQQQLPGGPRRWNVLCVAGSSEGSATRHDINAHKREGGQ